MSTSTTCPKCGTLNAQWAKFCANCGNPLTTPLLQTPTAPISSTPPPPVSSTTPVGPPTTTPPTVTYPTATPPPWYTYTPRAAYHFERETQIDRTKTGLLLLIIGALLQPVPYIGIVGSLIVLVGAILVILGRNAFGPAHSRNAVLSIVIYVVGLAIYFAGGLIFAFQLIIATRTANGNSAQISQALSSSFTTLIIALIIGGAVVGIARVLFTYAIQNQNGRIILWAAFASGLAISIIGSIIIGLALSDAIARSITVGGVNPGPLQNLRDQLQAYGLISGLTGFIPAALYSAALYLVWSRIGRGELPPKEVPSTPTPMTYP